MTALAQDRKTLRYGDEGNFLPLNLSIPVAASTKIYAGSIVAKDASGNAVPASANPALVILGRAAKQVDNSAGAAAAVKVPIDQGTFYFNASGSITKAHVGLLCFCVDDNTVSMSDGAGLYPAAGIVFDVNSAGQVAVTLGQPNLYSLNPEVSPTELQGFRARAVVTSLAAYTGTGTGVLTGSANGAIATQDGVTLAVGDQILIPTGTANVTAVDAGPWVVTTLGTAGTKYVLSRPDWWAHGLAFPSGAVIEIGGEGTFWAGTSWKGFAAAGVVDTNDPQFFPGRVTQSVVLVAGTKTIANVPILSATRTGVEMTRTTANTSTLTTGGYQTTTFTPGALGTASLVIQAAVAAGTINVADVSTLALTIINW